MKIACRACHAVLAPIPQVVETPPISPVKQKYRLAVAEHIPAAYAAAVADVQLTLPSALHDPVDHRKDWWLCQSALEENPALKRNHCSPAACPAARSEWLLWRRFHR